MLEIAAVHGARPLFLDLSRPSEIKMIDGQGVTYFREIRDARGRIRNKIELPAKILETTFDTLFIKGVVDQTKPTTDPNMVEWTKTLERPQEIKTGFNLEGPPRTMASDQSHESSDMARNNMWSPSASVPTDCLAGGDQHQTSVHGELVMTAERKPRASSRPKSPTARSRAFNSPSKSLKATSHPMDNNSGNLDENLQLADLTHLCGTQVCTHELDIHESPHQREFAAASNLDSAEMIDADATTTASFARTTAKVLEEVEVRILPTSMRGGGASEARISHVF